MAAISHLQCTVCGKTYGANDLTYTCPDCGEVGTLDILFDYDALRQHVDRDALENNRDYSMWRFRNLLPIQPASSVPPLRVGFTPLNRTPILGASLGLEHVWIKDDGQNPTASFKDRASAMVVAHAMEANIQTVTTASTGNAAAALSGIAASVAMDNIIFVPASAPQAKIAQLLVYGSVVLLIEDTYDAAFDLCLEISQEQGWYCRNTGINPYTTEGKKTAAYEIAEQLNWNAPDVVVVSVGDGSIIGGLHKGFFDLYELGWIERIPRLVGVQSIGSSPLVMAWKNNIAAQDMRPVTVNSIADSIVASLPRDRAKALRAVRQTGGGMVAVSDEEILAAIPQMASLSGVFAEPAAAAALAGTQRALTSGLINIGERVVIVSTGNGLKDITRAQESVRSGLCVQPDLDAIRRALNLEKQSAPPHKANQRFGELKVRGNSCDMYRYSIKTRNRLCPPRHGNCSGLDVQQAIDATHLRYGGDVQDNQVKIDPGAKTTGSLVADFDRGFAIRDGLLKRRQWWTHKTRYCKPRFLNRSESKGWLALSLMSKVHNIETWVKRLRKFVPVIRLAVTAHPDKANFQCRLTDAAD